MGRALWQPRSGLSRFRGGGTLNLGRHRGYPTIRLDKWWPWRCTLCASRGVPVPKGFPRLVRRRGRLSTGTIVYNCLEHLLLVPVFIFINNNNILHSDRIFLVPGTTLNNNGEFVNTNIVTNRGEINNTPSGTVINNGLIDNESLITTTGSFTNNDSITNSCEATITGTISGNPVTDLCVPFLIPSGNISWWQAENDATDSADANDGTLESGATFSTGKVLQSFLFDGIDDYVSVPDSNNLDLIANFTMEGWINPEPGVTDYTILSKLDSTGSSGYELSIEFDSLAIKYGNGISIEPTSPSSVFIPSGSWTKMGGKSQ